MDKSKLVDMNHRFNERLKQLMSLKGQNTQFFSHEAYKEMIKSIKCLKSKQSHKKPEDYQRLRRFDVFTIGETEKLIVPVKEDNSVRYYVSEDEIFQILHDTHLKIGHGGRNRMEKELNLHYKNITREMIVIYLDLCENCEKKRTIPNKEPSVKPISSSELNSTCHVDLIDMQSQEDGPYTFILVYQEHVTKFVQLRPLITDTAEEVGYMLLDIFTIFGAPGVLQSSQGRRFVNKIIQEACRIWPEFKAVREKQRQSGSQELIKSAKQDVMNILSRWLKDNNTSKWSEGLRFVQLMKNRAYHTAINCTPYEAMFGKKLKVEVNSLSKPNEVFIEVDINKPEEVSE